MSKADSRGSITHPNYARIGERTAGWRAVASVPVAGCADDHHMGSQLRLHLRVVYSVKPMIEALVDSFEESPSPGAPISSISEIAT